MEIADYGSSRKDFGKRSVGSGEGSGMIMEVPGGRGSINENTR